MRCETSSNLWCAACNRRPASSACKRQPAWRYRAGGAEDNLTIAISTSCPSHSNRLLDKFFESNPGFRSRIAHHIDFPDYSDDELLEIADGMLAQQNYRFDEKAHELMARYIELRRQQPHFANARSIRNALDRARLRQANRLFETSTGPLDAVALSTISAEDISVSRVFTMPGNKAASPGRADK